MENNLYLNFEEKTKKNEEQQGIQKGEEKSFYDKVLEERTRLETTDVAIENIVENKLKLSETPVELIRPSEPVKKYTHEEVFDSATKYFNGDTLAANVWMNKYALKDSDSNFYELNPNDMHRRLAKEIARIEEKYTNPMSENEVFDVLKDFKYIIPAGSPMAGVGNDNQISSLSN